MAPQDQRQDGEGRGQQPLGVGDAPAQGGGDGEAGPAGERGGLAAERRVERGRVAQGVQQHRVRVLVAVEGGGERGADPHGRFGVGEQGPGRLAQLPQVDGEGGALVRPGRDRGRGEDPDDLVPAAGERRVRGRARHAGGRGDPHLRVGVGQVDGGCRVDGGQGVVHPHRRADDRQVGHLVVPQGLLLLLVRVRPGLLPRVGRRAVRGERPRPPLLRLRRVGRRLRRVPQEGQQSLPGCGRVLPGEQFRDLADGRRCGGPGCALVDDRPVEVLQGGPDVRLPAGAQGGQMPRGVRGGAVGVEQPCPVGLVHAAIMARGTDNPCSRAGWALRHRGGARWRGDHPRIHSFYGT
ncbi:hypothetical protein OG937_30560 [Streptomyces sp. NBC_00510]